MFWELYLVPEFLHDDVKRLNNRIARIGEIHELLNDTDAGLTFDDKLSLSLWIVDELAAVTQAKDLIINILNPNADEDNSNE